MALETGNYIANLVAANPPGTDPKSQGDDHLRLLKNALLNCFAGFAGAVMVTGTDGGVVNAYTLTTTPALIGYTTRMIAVFSPTIQNTGAATLNISGLGTRPIVTVDGTPVVSGDLAVGTIYAAAYDGASFRLLSITKNYADQLSFGASLPAQAGNADKFITTNGSVASWSDLIKVGTMKFADSADTTKRVLFDLSGLTTGQDRIMKWPDRSGYVGGMDRSSRTANATLTQADANADIVITGAGGFTQTLTAAAILGAGWNCRYWNASSANITFDPNASELIDGATTGILEPGMGIDIRCDGTKFDCERIGPSVTKILTSGTSGTFPLGVRLVTSVQGGAGGGGGRSTTTTAGRGANSGATARKQWIVSPNTGYTYTIGAKGTAAPAAGGTGTNGSNTTFTYNAVTVTTNGGIGGDSQNSAPQTVRQTATGGDVNISSGLGTIHAEESLGGAPGFGLGLGGVYSSGFSTGSDPTGFCAGGASGNSTAVGTNGADGVIILEY